MLVFFIHGVATRNVKYADDLKENIKKQLVNRGKPLPHFYSSFWGNALNDISKMWNCVQQDFQDIKKEYPQAKPEDIFRYKQLREGFLSEFVGDFFTYLNPERGFAIRKTIAQQLDDFVNDFPEETELHIIAHSLGTVILWDILFSDRFNPDDPAFLIRSMIEGLDSPAKVRVLKLKTITTMASPIVFINTMLAVKAQQIQSFAATYQREPLQWLNILHASDIIAYPLKHSLTLYASNGLQCRDEYIVTDANLAEKTARSLGQIEAAMALGIADAHGWYLKCQQTATLIVNHLLNEKDLIQNVIRRLHRVRGMTLDQKTHEKSAQETINLKDGSGKLYWSINQFQVHHVAVFDRENHCQFSGYVGWLDANPLKEELEFIKNQLAD